MQTKMCNNEDKSGVQAKCFVVITGPGSFKTHLTNQSQHISFDVFIDSDLFIKTFNVQDCFEK